MNKIYIAAIIAILVACLTAYVVYATGHTNISPPSTKTACFTDNGVITAKSEIPHPDFGLFGGGRDYTITFNNATYAVGRDAFYGVKIGDRVSLTRCMYV